jgi:hypothetical protein
MRSDPSTRRALSRPATCAAAVAAFLFALAGTGHALRAADLPSWPLQQQPGPDGDPRQDKTTWPRSSAPFSPAAKKTGAPRPALEARGDSDFVLGGGWKLQEIRRVAGTARELSVPGVDSGRWTAAAR